MFNDMKIKQVPEDFIVDEVIQLKLVKDRTNYVIFKLSKNNWDSFKVMNNLSKALNIKNKLIGYAGNKDKIAITSQYVSFYRIPKERIERIKMHDVRLEFVGYAHDRINLGDLDGNDFIITLRDLDKEVVIPKNIQLENYFGDQRFGNKANTHLVGKAIIKKDFKLACELLNITISNNDFIFELRKQPRRLLRFYISSYQAFIWNRLLSDFIKKQKNSFKISSNSGDLYLSKSSIENFKLPLISFDSELSDELKVILEEENISLKDFIIPQMPELTTETVYRNAFIDVKDISYEYSDDELNKNKLKIVIKFFLPKGCYATMLLSKLESYLNEN